MVILLHIKIRWTVLLYAVKTVEGDFRFTDVGQTHNENSNDVNIFISSCMI